MSDRSALSGDSDLNPLDARWETFSTAMKYKIAYQYIMTGEMEFSASSKEKAKELASNASVENYKEFTLKVCRN